MNNGLLRAESVIFYITMGLYFLSVVLYFAFFAIKKEKLGKYAKLVFFAAFAMHTVSIAVRGIGAGRLPLTNQYEFACAFAWGISLCFLLFLLKFNFNALGAFVTPVIFIIIGYAAMQSKEVKSLMPALQSNWLSLHVTTAIIGYGSFGVAFAVSLMFLLRKKLCENNFWSEHIPSEEKLDIISYRAISLGFLFLTLVIVTGAIWAEQAWGSYWSWDPKETWALITWIIYAVYLHLRISKGWKGRSAAIFATVGFVCVLFTYIGVNTLLPGVHSYA